MDDHQIQTTKIVVSGMTCGHCVQSVTDELTALPSVQAVNIELDAGGDSEVFVESTGPLDMQAAKDAVAEAGYVVVR